MPDLDKRKCKILIKDVDIGKIVGINKRFPTFI